MRKFFFEQAFLLFSLALISCHSSAWAGADGDSMSSQSETMGEPENPALRVELLELYARDQEARSKLLALLPENPSAGGNIKLDSPSMEEIGIIMNVKALEVETTTFMKNVIDEHGFPGISMVGEDGAHAAWMLIQHADGDPDFQQRALELMEPLVRSGQADPSDFAHLTDRVLLARGEKQRFGTQLAKDGNGVLRPRPTESPETLDQRRAEFGLLELTRHLELLSTELGLETDDEPLDAE